MSGVTQDISQFCKLEWFKWIMFCDEIAPFPDDTLKLGCYLGPSIDVDSAITTKVFTEKGQLLHRSTHQLLTPDELLDKEGSGTQEQFMARVYDILGFHVIPRDLEELELENTLQCDPYKVETQKEQSFPQLTEELKPMPEVGDYYIRAGIFISRGNQMAHGHVVARSKDTNGNVVGRSHTNPTLDTRTFQVEFTGGKDRELTANIITGSMYAIQMEKSIYSWIC